MRQISAPQAHAITGGSRAVLPPVEGLAEARPYTNETIFDELRARPDGLLILGGGPIGCELGQAFARLGVRVTIVEMSDRILEKEDPDVAEVVRRALEADGVRLILGGKARRVKRLVVCWLVATLRTTLATCFGSSRSLGRVGFPRFALAATGRPQ